MSIKLGTVDLSFGGEVVDLTTDQTIAGNKTFSGILANTVTEFNKGDVTGTTAISYADGLNQRFTVTGTTDLSFNNPTRDILQLIITNGGAHSITWPVVKWAGGTVPELTASGTDVVSIYYDGTDYFGDYQTGFATI